MNSSTFHPATIGLLRLQSRGRRRRMWIRFCQPRRLALSSFACLLTVLWLGNTAVTVWLRESASPEVLGAMLSLGFVLYAAWHFTKVAFFRPENPFDWTPHERDILLGLPLAPRDLVAYQLASVTVTTLLKATLFTVLLLPDLRSVPLGILGIALAMMALELLRMAVDIAAWGMSRPAFLAYRATVVVALVAVGLAIAAVALGEDLFTRPLGADEGYRQRVLSIVVLMNESFFGCAAVPFKPFVELILADRLTVSNVLLAAAVLGSLIVLSVGVTRLYWATVLRVALREKASYDRGDSAASAISTTVAQSKSEITRSHLRHISRLGGIGPLVWRQLVGARRHAGSLLTAMIAPAVLACLPCFALADPHIGLLATTGTLAFYTFLLLPTALRFDFRRDLDRLAMLKGLPITPAAAAIGQTLAPVLIASAFQTAVLAFAIAVRSLPPHYLGAAMLVMVPLNMLVFALDNLIYLLYPYRVQQEGLEVFLRTMLTFTGKGLLFAVGLQAMATWGFATAALTRGVSRALGISLDAYVVFTGGLIAGLSLVSAFVLCALCHTYRKMSPIEDVPR